MQVKKQRHSRGKKAYFHVENATNFRAKTMTKTCEKKEKKNWKKLRHFVYFCDL